MTEEQEKRLAALYSWAQDQVNAGNWLGAIKTLEELLAMDPSHEEAPELLARAQVEEARANRLAQLYEQAQERVQVSDWERAIALCEEIMTVDPRYRDVRTLMEQAQQAQKKLSAVAEKYRTGMLSFETGEWPIAIEMFKQVAETDAEYRDALGKLEMAQAELTRQARLSERYQAGLKYIRRKQWAEAVAALEEVVAEDETFAEEEAEERLQEAREHLGREQAETVARLYDAGTEYFRKGEWALAVEALEQVVAHDPEYPGAPDLLAQAREKRDDEQQAQDLYEIGVQHGQRGNWAEAVAAFTEVLELIPNYRDTERRLRSARTRTERQKRAAASTMVSIPVPPTPQPGRAEPMAVPFAPSQPRTRPTGLIAVVLLSVVALLAVCVVLVGLLAWPTVQQIALGPGGPSPTPQQSPILITATPSPTVEGQDRMAFVQSVTAPDGTSFTPGASFPKVWRLRNVGSQTWEGYTLAFVAGEQMGAPAEVPVPTTPPGETTDVIVSLVAPQEPGPHSGQWRVKNAHDQFFGDPLHVIIQVAGDVPPATSTPTPKPSAAPGTPTPEQTVWPTAAPKPSATPTLKPTSAGTPKPQPTKTSRPAAVSGRIAFPLWNSKTGKYDVEVINADGSGQYRVMANVRQPCWNADGSWLAVNGEIRWKEGILIMQAGGEKLRAVSTQAHHERPTWSPQGNRIAFDADTGGDHVFVIDDIKEKADLTFRPLRYADKDVPGRYVTWMSNGNLILSSVDYWDTGQKSGLFVAGPDGGVMWQVTTSGVDTAPAVSKSGRVAFMSRREAEGDWEIYTVSLAGGDAELKQLTNNSVHDGLPTWSPDGRHIAFVSNEGGWGIWLMRADGSGRRKIKDLGPNGLLEDWTGERISWAP